MNSVSAGSRSVLGVGTDPRLLDRSTAECSRQGAVAVETVTSADEAVSRLPDVDCLVTAYDLPETDGVTLVQRIRDEYPEFPVILVTDQPDDRVASEAIGAGVTDYVRRDADEAVRNLGAAIEAGITAWEDEQALREREDRYRILVERSHDGIYIYQDSRFLFVNDRITEITGYDAEELYEMEIWELVHPDDRERVKAFGARRRRGENAPDTYEAKVVTADGETRHLEFSVQSTTYDGEWAVLGSVRDVTERRRQERELAETKEFIETILDTLEDVIFVFSLDGELLRWNDELCAVTGYTDAELEEMETADLVAQEYYDDAVGQVRNAIATGSSVIEVEVITKAGDRLPFEFRGAPLTDEDDEPVAIAGVARDISERLAREEELIQYQTIVEAVGDAVYTLDESGRITFVNDALLSVTGYDEGELLGEFVGSVMREQDVETATSLIAEMLESEDRNRATFEMEAVTRDGEHIPCEDNMALLCSDGEFRGTAGVVRNISQRKAREEQLRRQNERLDRFASVVSHDLRNPLNVILGRVEVAREREAEAHLDAIERSALRMERMIDDLLTLARDGRTVGEPEPLELAAAARRAWKNVETHDATLRVDANAETLLADRDRLASLLENLVRNAIDHGGRDVTVSIGSLDGSADGASGFYVEDDGEGIPEDAREQVFESGYSTADDGTGLGLVIVEDIADAHDWSLRATEGSLGGARFEIRDVDWVEG